MAPIALRSIREEIKNYIDQADAKLVRMIHAMLEIDAQDEAHWWAGMPDHIKTAVNEAIMEADAGEVIPHEEVKKLYPQWFTK